MILSILSITGFIMCFLSNRMIKTRSTGAYRTAMIVGLIGVPLACLGYFRIANLVNGVALGRIMTILAYICLCAGQVTMALRCIDPLIYNELRKYTNKSYARRMTENILLIVPICVYVLLGSMILFSIFVWISMFKNALMIHKLLLLFNPIPFMIVQLVLSKARAIHRNFPYLIYIGNILMVISTIFVK